MDEKKELTVQKALTSFFSVDPMAMKKIFEETMLFSFFVDFRLMSNRSVWIKMIYLLVSSDNFYLMINGLFFALTLSRNQCR